MLEFFLLGGRSKSGNTIRKTAVIIAGSIAIVVVIIVGIGCKRKIKLNRKLNTLPSKRYDSLLQVDFHVIQYSTLKELRYEDFADFWSKLF